MTGDARLSRPASPPHPPRRRFGCSLSPRSAARPSSRRRRRARARGRRLSPRTRRPRASSRDRGRRSGETCCGSPGTSATGICRCRSSGERLRIREDHVIAEMVTGLGGRITRSDAPFDPEFGAYAGVAHVARTSDCTAESGFDSRPLSHARLVFARLSGWRLQLFAWSRSCRRERRSARSGVTAGLDRRDARSWRRPNGCRHPARRASGGVGTGSRSTDRRQPARPRVPRRPRRWRSRPRRRARRFSPLAAPRGPIPFSIAGPKLGEAARGVLCRRRRRRDGAVPAFLSAAR